MTVAYIVFGVILVIVIFIAISYKKMKNAPTVPSSTKIKVLTNKNFKQVMRKGVVLIDFWADWCMPCKMLVPTLNDLAENEEGFTIAKVNVDQQQALAGKYKIRNLPTIVIFKDGKEVERMMGAKSKHHYLNALKKYL